MPGFLMDHMTQRAAKDRTWGRIEATSVNDGLRNERRLGPPGNTDSMVNGGAWSAPMSQRGDGRPIARSRRHAQLRPPPSRPARRRSAPPCRRAGPGALTGRLPSASAGGANVSSAEAHADSRRPSHIPVSSHRHARLTMAALLHRASEPGVLIVRTPSRHRPPRLVSHPKGARVTPTRDTHSDTPATFSTDTAGLEDCVGRRSSISATATPSTCASRRSSSSSATTGSGCSPTTGRSRPDASGHTGIARSASVCATTPTSRPPSTGTGCASTTGTTACPTRPRRPIPLGGEFTYRLRFPDAGLYWYHPHIREDYGLDMGLYGNLVVVPAEEDYWPPVNREVAVTLDDVLIEEGQVAPFHRRRPDLRGDGSVRQRHAHGRRHESRAQRPRRRGRPPLPHQHRQHPALQRRVAGRAYEAGRRRQRPLRARDLRRRGPARPVRAGQSSTCCSTPPGTVPIAAPARRPHLHRSAPSSSPTSRGRSVLAREFELLRTAPELTAERARIDAAARATPRQDAGLRVTDAAPVRRLRTTAGVVDLSDAPRRREQPSKARARTCGMKLIAAWRHQPGPVPCIPKS